MHIHISAIHSFVTFLMVLVWLGATRLLAQKFQGHNLADTYLSLT